MLHQRSCDHEEVRETYRTELTETPENENTIRLQRRICQRQVQREGKEEESENTLEELYRCRSITVGDGLSHLFPQLGIPTLWMMYTITWNEKMKKKKKKLKELSDLKWKHKDKLQKIMCQGYWESTLDRWQKCVKVKNNLPSLTEWDSVLYWSRLTWRPCKRVGTSRGKHQEWTE